MLKRMNFYFNIALYKHILNVKGTSSNDSALVSDESLNSNFERTLVSSRVTRIVEFMGVGS